MANLKVLTLNCWGVPIPFVCEKRKQRMLAIGEELSKGEYDIVILQEVWDKADYKTIKEKTEKAFAYSHYFYSGVVGSGLFVLSKFPICETLFHRYPISGYVQKIQHGDWFGGKGVGLCVIKMNDLHLNLYSTHLHAEYHRENDEYLAHRISQSLELSQFIKNTSMTCNFILLAGDLNLEPNDLGYKLIRSYTNLFDSWIEKKSTLTEDKEGNTCDIPTNSFSQASPLLPKCTGKRIDYILYSPGQDAGVGIEVNECSVTMGKVPGESFNFSDHEGVRSVLSISKAEKTDHVRKSEYDRKSLLEESLLIINSGLKKVKEDNSFFFILMVVSAVVLCGLVSSGLPVMGGFLESLLIVLVSIVMFTLCIILYILNKNEEHSLYGSRDSIQVLLRQY